MTTTTPAVSIPYIGDSQAKADEQDLESLSKLIESMLVSNQKLLKLHASGFFSKYDTNSQTNIYNCIIQTSDTLNTLWQILNEKQKKIGHPIINQIIPSPSTPQEE